MPRRRTILGGTAAVAAGVAALVAVLAPRGADAFVVRALVSDVGLNALTHDAALVNAWGLASSPTGPWWTANEARGRSTLYAADGKKQSLTVVVDGGPTGIVYHGGGGFRVRSGGVSAPARFIYACEDGMLRGWAPSVPHSWSRTAEVAVDDALAGAVFRGVAIATLPGGAQRLYATDFHNARVDVFDAAWRRILRDAFVDRSIPSWYAPFGVQVAGGRVFVTYASRAPVNGNDSPTGGYVDEFDLDGALVARVGGMGPLNEPWGVALAPRSLGGRLFVGNFGSGRINVYARDAAGWSFRGQLRGGNGKPLAVPGVWGIAFGNGGMAGPSDTLFFAAGPHRWRGASELSVHGLFGSIAPTR
ncbi:MAG TPA: TIGR03118 family protein [Gaiellaceae bacterium]